MTYSPTKFEVASSYGLGGDTFTRNVTDGRTYAQTDGRRTDFDTKLIYPFFLKKIAGIKNCWENSSVFIVLYLASLFHIWLHYFISGFIISYLDSLFHIWIHCFISGFIISYLDSLFHIWIQCFISGYLDSLSYIQIHYFISGFNVSYLDSLFHIRIHYFISRRR